MKRIHEWIEVNAEGEEPDAPEVQHAVPHMGFVIDNMVAQWGGIAYAELSVILVHLRYLAMLHQTHHWISKGDSFYGDHGLFERLYNKVVEEVDTVAERSIGLANEFNVNLQLQTKQLMQLVQACTSPQTVPQSNDLARASLAAEQQFMKIMNAAMESLRSNGTMTPGLENMLEGIADGHEQNIYLLKRRCTSGAMGL